MKRKIFFVATACLCVLFSTIFFRQKKAYRPGLAERSPAMEKGVEEDWREAAKFEFEITKDPSLGYVPKDRLLTAAQDVQRGLYSRSSFTDDVTAAALFWTERGPNQDIVGPDGNARPPGVSCSGRVDALCIDRSDPSGHTVWIGSRSGGIWKTNNINLADPGWIPVYDGMNNLGIASICQDPSNFNILYAGTGDKTNQGSIRGGGIWKSTDHGVTWSLLPATTGFWNISKIECDNSGKVYAASNASGAGIQRSVNGGATWTDITPAGLSKRIADMDLSNNGTLHVYCGFSQGDIANCGYRYTASPATVSSSSGWIVPVVSFPLSKQTVQMAVSGNRLLAMPADLLPGANNHISKVYLSLNGGANWATADSTPEVRYWMNLDAAINPVNTDQIIIGSFNSSITNNNGATWTKAGDGFSTAPGKYVHHDYHAILWKGNEILIGCDGGVFFSSDNGVSFSPKNKGLKTFEFYSCNFHPSLPDYFLGGTQDNGCEQLTQPGLGIATHIIGGDGGYMHVDQDEPQYQFGAYTYNECWRSTNSGANWSNINNSSAGQFINPTDYDDLNNKMYCGGNAGEYVRWEDPHTGNTFTAVPVSGFNSRKISSLVLSPFTQHRLFTGLESGKLFRLDNIHTSSPAVSDISGTGMPAANISSINTGTNDNNLIATFSNYGVQHVWITTAGGGVAGWMNVSGNLPDIPVRWGIFHPDDNDRAIIATDLGVWETNNLDGNATVWIQNTSLPAVRTNMLQYRASDRTLVAATFGRGIWTTVIPPVKPYIRFVSSTVSPLVIMQPETTTNTSSPGCRRYKDYTIPMSIDMAPVGNATVTLSVVAATSTAVRGTDVEFTTNGNFASPNNVLTFSHNATTKKTLMLRVYDDAAREGTESFTITYTVTGSTNALTAPTNNTFTCIIKDNDDPVDKPIETLLGKSATEYAVSAGTYFFYTNSNGNIIAHLQQDVTANYGCITAKVFNAGTTWQSYSLNGVRSQKVIQITPSQNPSVTCMVGLYFTAAELGGNTLSKLKIGKTNQPTMSTVTPFNTELSPTTVTPFGNGYLFTAKFKGLSKFFLVDASADISSLPVTLLSFEGQLVNNVISLGWRTSTEQNSHYFEIEKSVDGTSFTSLGRVMAAGNSTSLLTYEFTDTRPGEFNYYRLKMVDKDGHFTYSHIILIKNPGAEQNLWVTNPFSNEIRVRFTTLPQKKIKLQLQTTSGQTVYTNEVLPAGEIRLDVSGVHLSQGIYFLIVWADDRRFVHKLVKR